MNLYDHKATIYQSYVIFKSPQPFHAWAPETLNLLGLPFQGWLNKEYKGKQQFESGGKSIILSQSIHHHHHHHHQAEYINNLETIHHYMEDSICIYHL